MRRWARPERCPSAAARGQRTPVGSKDHDSAWAFLTTMGGVGFASANTGPARIVLPASLSEQGPGAATGETAFETHGYRATRLFSQTRRLPVGLPGPHSRS